MRKDAVGALRAIALFVERTRTDMMVLAVFAFWALAFQVIVAKQLWVCDSFASARRSNTFPMGFATVAAT